MERRRFAAFGIAARFIRDQSGVYAVLFGLVAPIFIGALALGAETGLWYSTQASMQGAADSAAISAAVGLNAGDPNVTLQAKATAASDGFVAGSSGTVVTVNRPPLSGPNVGKPGAVEVIITQPQNLLFAKKWLPSPVVVKARAVAGPPPDVTCVLAKGKGLLSLIGSIDMIAFAAILADQCNVADNNPGPLALTMILASITAQKVSVVGGILNLLGSITTTQGVYNPAPPTPDPFEGLAVGPIPPLCQPNSFDLLGLLITDTRTLNQGRYCGGIRVGLGGNVTLTPGTYYLDQGLLGLGALNFTVALGGTVTGTGVTIVMPPSNPLIAVPVVFALQGVVNLTAPKSGSFADVVLFVPPGPLISAVAFAGVQPNLVGMIYLPGSAVVYGLSGAAHTGQCTGLIADSIVIALGGASFSKCYKTLGPSSGSPVALLE